MSIIIRLGRGSVLLGLLIASGCTVTRRGVPNTGDGGPTADTGPQDTGRDTGFDSLPPVNVCSPGCGDTELCDNGLDDDCDGTINEDCTCSPGESFPCFIGPPDRRGLGVCSDGVISCGEFGWSSCQGSIGPTQEVCDGQDNDCNGATDEGLTDCVTRVTCPSGLEAAPLSNFPLTGSAIYSGSDATSWRWEISCPSGLAGVCPAPTDANQQDTQVYLTVSGVYQVRLTIGFADGGEESCTYPIAVRGGGLRVELNWDTLTAGVDLDLHVHRFTDQAEESAFFSPDDCYWANCAAGAPVFFSQQQVANWRPINWSLPTSPLENCDEAPGGNGARWTALGACRNPRLDVDTNALRACDPDQQNPTTPGYCAPENINIDRPEVGRPYRIMVNYFENPPGYELEDIIEDGEVVGRELVGYEPGPATQPSVRIYCGGQIRGTFGDGRSLSDNAEFSPGFLLFPPSVDFTGPNNTGWHVADVVFFEGPCGLDCEVFPVDVVRNNASDFGPDWSCDYNSRTQSCE